MIAKKKPFNKYSLTEAYQFLHCTDPIPWDLVFEPVSPSPVFYEELNRLQAFDITSNERGKEVLIDTILQEALSRRTKLKVWKEVALKTEVLSGRTEYLFAPRFRILTHPYICLAEAKKDDFEQGAAQCLLGMKTCQLLNAKEQLVIDMHGIVTNAAGWQFYKLTLQDEVYESPLYSFQTQMPTLFGILDAIFATCEHYLDDWTNCPEFSMQTGIFEKSMIQDQALKDFATQTIRAEFAARGIDIKQMILFGSRARGDATPDSDWDFLVIISIDLNFYERAKIATMIRRKFAVWNLSADIIIKSEARLIQERGNVGVLSYYALKEGVRV